MDDNRSALLRAVDNILEAVPLKNLRSARIVNRTGNGTSMVMLTPSLLHELHAARKLVVEEREQPT